MLGQRLCIQSRLFDELLQVATHHEARQCFDRRLLHLRAVARGEYQ